MSVRDLDALVGMAEDRLGLALQPLRYETGVLDVQRAQVAATLALVEAVRRVEEAIGGTK